MPALSRILIGCFVLVSACGGGDSTSTQNGTEQQDAVDESTPTGAIVDPETERGLFGLGSLEPNSAAVANALVQSHGGDGGFVALVSALERGYRIDQLSTAALDDRVRVDGVIVAVDGAIEAPTGPRLGVIVLPKDDDDAAGADEQGSGVDVAPAALRRARQLSQDSAFEPLGLLAQLRSEFGGSIEPDEDPRAVLIAIIVELASNGYGFDQIIDSLVLGDAFIVLAGGCTTLSRGLGANVVPATHTGTECSDRLRSDLELDDSPAVVSGADKPAETDAIATDVSVLVGVYEGTVDLVQCGLSCSFECSVPTSISIALGPDGTLTGGFDAQARWNANSCVDPLTGARNPIEGFWEDDGTLAFTTQNVFGFTAEGSVVGGVLTAILVESGTADNTAADGTGTVVVFDVEAVKTR